VLIKHLVNSFSPLIETGAVCQRVADAVFDCLGKFIVCNDGAAECFELVEGCGILVAKAEGDVFGFECGPSGFTEPVINARSAFTPCVI